MTFKFTFGFKMESDLPELPVFAVNPVELAYSSAEEASHYDPELNGSLSCV